MYPILFHQIPSGSTEEDTTDTSTTEARGATGQEGDTPKETRPPGTSPQIDPFRPDSKVGGWKPSDQVNKERAEHVLALEERVKAAKALVMRKQAEKQKALEEKVRKV